MKLDWEINEFRVLKAKVGEVTYYVAPGVIDLWRPHKQYTAFDGKAATVWPVEGGMSLTNAIAWCERDVERPEGCPAQPPAADPVAPKTAGEMSGKTSSPLGSFDARVWAKEFMRCNNGLSGPFVSSHVGPFPADRLRDMARRIAELESWLGTKKYAPEDNLASKTWTKLEQLTNRLERLEART